MGDGFGRGRYLGGPPKMAAIRVGPPKMAAVRGGLQRWRRYELGRQDGGGAIRGFPKAERFDKITRQKTGEENDKKRV